MAPQKPDLNRLDRLEDKLYSPDAKFDVRPRRPLKAAKSTAPTSWQGSENAVSADAFVASLRRTPSNPFAKVFIAALAFFLLAAGYGFWKLGPGASGTREGTEDIRISVVGATTAPGGQEYSFDVVVQNMSGIDLRLVDLIVEMPPGTRDAETLREDVPRRRIPLGEIGAGETRRQTVAVALFGDEGERKEFGLRLEYRSPNSPTIFEKRREYEVALSAAPVLLTVDALSEITPGQKLELVAKLSSNSPSPLGPLGLRVEYPFGFKLETVSEAPREDRLWVFERLLPGESREVRIVGTLDGAHGDERLFRFSAGALGSASSTEITVPYGTRAVAVAVSKPFLALNLSLDESVAPEVVRWSEDEITARLAVVNNTKGPIRDAVVEMRLTGRSLDERSVQASDGVYRSADNTLLWDKTTADELEEIGAGETVWLSFGFQSLPLASRDQVFANPELVVDAEAKGRRVFDENVPEELVAKLFKRVKLVTEVEVESSVAHRSGPNPPRVDTASGYRVTWVVRNTSSDVESGLVAATLPPLVEWAGVAGSEDVSYDASSRRVTWRVGKVVAGAGYGQPERRASFDVTLVPTVSQEGRAAELVGAPAFVGRDTFAGAEFESTGSDLATADAPGSDGKVWSGD